MEMTLLVLDVEEFVASLIPVRRNRELAGRPGRAGYLLWGGELAIVCLCTGVSRCWRLGG